MHVLKRSKFSSLLLKLQQYIIGLVYSSSVRINSFSRSYYSVLSPQFFSNNLFDTILNLTSRDITVDDVPEHFSIKPCTKRSSREGSREGSRKESFKSR